MIELARHIEILLLENDCVIVPELGGFIAHYQPAYYAESDNIYFPPMRTIGFNPQLTMNDGLLVQSYMQVHHTDFPDATRMIEQEVEELKDTLYKDGHVQLYGIGDLHYTIHNSYEFRPNEEGILSPYLYGFSSLSISPLSENNSTIASTKDMVLKPQKEKAAIRFNRRWLGNAVAIAVAVILLFFLSVPVENTYVDKGNYASLGTDGLFEAIRSQSLATTLVVPQQQKTVQAKKTSGNTRQQAGHKSLKPVAVKVEKVGSPKTETSKQETGKETPKAEKTVARKTTPATATASSASVPAQNKAEATTAKPKYFIIVSSLATAADAQQTLNEYKQKGFKEASIIEGSGRYRLALYGFADKNAAYKKMNELKKDEAFKNAWLLSSK